MLDLASVDLRELGEALEDHSYEHSWWLDPVAGEIRFHSPDADEETVDDLDEAGLMVIDPIPSAEAYGDMQDFVAAVQDRRPRDLLGRAIEGRGAFRRFKDTLFEFPDLRGQWFAFHDARMRRRAIGWLADNGLIDETTARAACGDHPDPLVGGAIATLSRAVAEGLRVLYGDRLVDVLVFGSVARGDATEESDLDLLVVLDRVDDAGSELDAMDEVLWRHTARSGVVIAALPVGVEAFRRPRQPVVIRAKAEAVPA